MEIGFSTGSLAFGDFKSGIELLKENEVPIVEISALRESELQPLIDEIGAIDLSYFDYVSFHAPSKRVELSECELIKKLMLLAEIGHKIVVHPDIMEDYKAWGELGSMLCIENMDKRKPIGRTFMDLEFIFKELPDAKFCLDLAHARQVDPTMGEAKAMVHFFKERLSQIHLSTLNAKSKHEPLNIESLFAYSRVSHLLPSDIPIILESPVTPDEIKSEILKASFLFNNHAFVELFKKIGMSLDDFEIVPNRYDSKVIN